MAGHRARVSPSSTGRRGKPTWRIGLLSGAFVAITLAAGSPAAPAVCSAPAVCPDVGRTALRSSWQDARPDPLSRLRRWADKHNGALDELRFSDAAELGDRVDDVAAWISEDTTRVFASLTALLDLVDLLNPGGDARTGEPYAARVRSARAVDSLLRRWLSGPRGDELLIWLATHVLSMPRLNPVGRRVAALSYMEGRYVDGTLLALLEGARSKRGDLKQASIAALVGWPHAQVHGFMAGLAVESLTETEDVPAGLVRRHFEAIGEGIDGGTSGELVRVLGIAATSTEWRTAVRAVDTLATLPNSVAVQPLIESLSVWLGRGERGQSSKRVVGSILNDLEKRSGRRIGEHPERWARWWQVAQTGKITTNRAADPRPRTAASFFGLRPMTDRVVFVIDRSRSMKARFGTDEANTRYEEAIEQMIQLLRELGPAAKFSVVLFNDRPQRWSRKLQLVTDANLDSAERWARSRVPDGGTELLPAIEMVMELDRRGVADLDRLEADTVIVLCDGQTSRGPGWVRPLLERVNPSTCLVFHCVQIGTTGNGTLERLAEKSGGDFVRVQP